tara:strand:+ start:281 stop:415 length:135 start_codon:yes stop_codon:yes gene_type:complete
MNKWIIGIIIVVVLFGGLMFSFSSSSVGITLGNGNTPVGMSDPR